MSETRWTPWTPGPWGVEDDHPDRAVLDVRDSDGWDVATLYSARGDVDTRDSSGVWRDDQVRNANARLIAAAPELYEALEFALSAIDAIADEMTIGDLFTRVDAMAPCRAALAKARGES